MLNRTIAKPFRSQTIAFAQRHEEVTHKPIWQRQRQSHPSPLDHLEARSMLPLASRFCGWLRFWMRSKPSRTSRCVVLPRGAHASRNELPGCTACRCLA